MALRNPTPGSQSEGIYTIVYSGQVKSDNLKVHPEENGSGGRGHTADMGAQKT